MQSGQSWTVAEPSNPQLEEAFARELHINAITARCLINRGFSNVKEVEAFLHPKLNRLESPEKMADLRKAAMRTADAIASRQRIGIFGDYDVDGLTSAALIYLFLCDVGASTEPTVADRFSGGYGLVPETVTQLYENGCRLLVVLDCGTSDHQAMARAKELGMDVIVVDHHRIETQFPDSFAFVNPHRTDCGFPDKDLAAVGLAFYFCAAIRTELVHIGYIERDKVDPRNYLDLVALGTVADVVPLTKNNRILASHGLRVLSDERRPGLEALVNSSRIRARKLQSSHISYQLAPRINAAGRLASAKDAFELLVCSSSRDADRYAMRLEQFTQERRTIEEQVTGQARKQAAVEDRNGAPILVLSGPQWHKGVLGIVAARLSEEFSKPTYVIGFDGEIGTGSARGQGQINLYNSLKHTAGQLVRYGGHRDAAGFTVAQDHLKGFKESLINFAKENWTSVDSGKLVCDATLSPVQLTSQLLSEIQQLGPFGQENPEPVFNIVGLDVLSTRVVGINHLKLELKTPSGTVSAFGPRMGEYANKVPHMINVAASIALDEWRGEGVVELRLVRPPVDCTESDVF